MCCMALAIRLTALDHRDLDPADQVMCAIWPISLVLLALVGVCVLAGLCWEGFVKLAAGPLRSKAQEPEPCSQSPMVLCDSCREAMPRKGPLS